jgi:RNA polymerase sigma-70 factor (ECF subfamily)
MELIDAEPRRRAMPGNGRVMLDTVARHAGSDPVVTAISQHADMVYATCRRVLGNEADAADVAQETFFQFVKQADRIRGSVAGWLHQVATRRSIDFIRQCTSRRRREERYVADTAAGETSWNEMEPLVDEAIEALSAESRELLLLHFLEGQSMGAIGVAKGVSQPTVSRRITHALDELRQNLQAKGGIVAAASLGNLLLGTAEAAPAPVLHSLGKLALAHTATLGAGTAAASSTLGGAKVAAIIAAGTLTVGTGWWSLRPQPQSVIPPPSPPINSVFVGFSTSVVWTVGPGGQRTSVFSTGTNYTVTNPGPPVNRPTRSAR